MNRRVEKVCNALRLQGIEPETLGYTNGVKFDYADDVYLIDLVPPRMNATHSAIWGPKFDKCQKGYDFELFDWIDTLIKPLPKNVIPLAFD